MLTRLRVRNYKSLRDVDIQFPKGKSNLTVLVGPNGAGKSNILDCLAFLREIAGNNLAKALEARGGFHDATWGSVQDIAGEIFLNVEGAVRYEETLVPFSYEITLKGAANPTIPEVRAERATWGRNNDELFLREGDKTSYKREQKGTNSVWITSLGNFQSGWPELCAIQESLRTWGFYDFQRSRIATRQPVRKETRLNQDGSNAATVLHWVRNQDVRTFARLESRLRTAIPEMEHLLTPPDEGGQVYIAFQERGVPGRIPAWGQSEGALRLVATLLALYLPTRQDMVALEAPEVALHPHLMEYVANLLEYPPQQTQVIVTTHSPYLLDYLPPESLVLVTKEAGSTRVSRPTRRKAVKEALAVLGLGELWYSGQLGGVPGDGSAVRRRRERGQDAPDSGEAVRTSNSGQGSFRPKGRQARG